MQQMKLQDLIYLNNAASIWPKPACVLNVVSRRIVSEVIEELVS
ncbi:hypothetical protein [Methanospirillum sp.]|nr:hypothetical protein [Methanospirillum sp.]